MSVPPSRRFVETEETFHFFNEEVVLGTNEIRSGDASSSSDSDSSDSSRLRRAKRRRRASSAASRRTSRRLSQLLNGSVLSELESINDNELSDSEDDDYESLDGFELEEEDDEDCQTRERNGSADNNDTETQSAAANAGAKVVGAGAAKYEQIFEPFRDLYLPPAQRRDRAASGSWSSGSKRPTGRQAQSRKARRAIAAFVRRVHCANGYRYRKQSEFLRVCYQRALESGPGYDLSETAKVDICLDTERKKEVKQSLLLAPQKEDAIETTEPKLFPRKWPHLPYRSPLQWKDDVNAAIEFLSRLAELPETSLMYEPIDISKFTDEVSQLLEISGGDLSANMLSPISESAFAGLLGLLGMGVQLQSFTLLSKVALQFIQLGQGTNVRVESKQDGNDGSIHPELQRLLDVFCSLLAKHVAEPTLAATFSRDLSAQWKVCSYQPSTSDAIATDGLYLYIFGRTGLLKIGTGHGTTVRDFVYAHNKEYVRTRDAERSWLCCIGDSLYCRTLVMPGHRVDRIRTTDLKHVQELVLAPNRALIGKGTSESSVYAMVTDGVDLFTIRCIDTYKKMSSSKSSSSRKHRNRTNKSRKSTPVSEIVGAVLGKTDSEPKSQSRSSGATIQVGDRVIRGPDWKWSSQDGEKGSPGTVERISTWGGVKGSGVTVRWDKNQRVNTYRWGAEGCYDLYVVIEKDGQVLERKPLPNDDRSSEAKIGETSKETCRGVDPDPLPRHQFVLYRHKVNEITSIMKLEEPDIDLFLDLTPSGDLRKQTSSQATGEVESQSGVETLSALHSHTVTLCTSKTSWMCDGGMSNCFGDNSAKRYRCTSGCDFDLCKSCLFATVIDKPPSKAASEADVADNVSSTSSASTTPAGNAVGTENDFAESGNEEATEPSLVVPSNSTSSECIDPFFSVDASLFAESEREVSLKKKEEDKEKQVQQTEEQKVNDLALFWCGFYTRKECQVALRRNGLQLNEASAWLHACGAYLREPMVVPTISSVVLAAKPKTGALDPVLLIAGTFYATNGQLCVVSPPGLYTVGDDHSDKLKRAANSCDASWFFSLETGALLADKPVLLKGIPAGSPTCVDIVRQRILVFSGYLNCLEEYVDHSQQSQNSVCEVSSCATLADTGRTIISQLAQMLRKRAVLPAYKHTRAGLQDILFRTGREPTSSDKQPEARDGGEHKASESSTKTKNRRLKNIRARLKELDRLCVKDRPGHIIPFCVDFDDEGLLQVLRALNYYCELLSLPQDNCDSQKLEVPEGTYGLVSNLLCILIETVQELELAGVTMALETSGEATQCLFKDTEHSLRNIEHHLFDGNVHETIPVEALSHRSQIVFATHFLLVWGIRKGVFCSSNRSEFFISACKNATALAPPEKDDHASHTPVAPALPDSFFALMLEPHSSSMLRTKRDCKVDLLRRLLYSLMDDGRISIGDFVPTENAAFSRFLEILFTLSKLESNNPHRKKWVADSSGFPFQTPISKALHSAMNYCCARMYAANVELTHTTPLKAIGQEVLEATASFECFARACFASALEMLRSYQVSALRSGSDQALASVVGTILPMVVAFIPSFPDQFSDELRADLLILMKTLDNLTTSNESDRAKIHSDASIFGGYQIVETPHPYNHTQPVFRRVVHIPGASVLHFEFDPRCRTSSEADIVFITSGLAWYQADRLSYGESSFGEDGGCFFGSYSRGNWPAGGLTIVGDTATVMLCATTQSRSGTGDKQRWGLKCTVRGLFDSPPPMWISEIGCAVANACSAMGDKLLRGPPMQNVEKVCQPWATQRHLFNVALPTCNLLKSGKWDFVNDVVKRTSRSSSFFATLSKYVQLRNLPPRYATARWTEALQESAAVLLVRSNYQNLKAWLASVDTQMTLSVESENALFHLIAVELGKLERWMLRQVQLVSEWHYLCVDKVGLDELMERYADNLDRLSELCQLKGIGFQKNDMTSCVKSIHELLVQETVESGPSGSHEAVAHDISAKARFLLARWQKYVECSSTYTKSASESFHSEVPENLSEVGKFLCSAVSLSSLVECSAIHSSRLESRLSGVNYCEEAFSSLRNEHMARFFVGRILHAVPSSNLMQNDGIFSGCALADPCLLVKMMISLNSYSEKVARVSESENELPAFRAVALADVWNCAHSMDSMPTRILGLEKTAKLIMVLDDAVNLRATELNPEDDIVTASGAEHLRGQVYDLAWILLRLLTEEVCGTDVSIYESAAWKVSLEGVFSELSCLYKHFALKCVQLDGGSVDTGTGQISANLFSQEAMQRLLCMVVNKVTVLYELPGTFEWWLKTAVDIVGTPSSSNNVSIASTRFIRYALELLGDALFDLKAFVKCSAGSNKVFGLDIQKVLLGRVGTIVSPLQSNLAAESDTALGDITHNTNAEHCVVIFRSELAVEKLVDVSGSVGEPDVSSLNISVEVSDGKDAGEKAVTEAIAECTAAQATMKHPSVRCDGCNQSPMRGFRFKCFTCANYDLCTTCYMNQTHNMDHPFVRLRDSAGTGDLLQPRSKGGGVVPETVLVGSNAWKGNLLRVLLDAQGYVVYSSGSRQKCCSIATSLAQLGFLVTVAHTDDIANVNALHDWEKRMQYSFEPGSSRLSHRRSSGSTEKIPVNRAGRDVINAFNKKAATVNSRQHGRQVENGRTLASELVAILRLIMSNRPIMQKWRSSTIKIITEILEAAPRHLGVTASSHLIPDESYFLTLGATQVLGGFRETLRVGGRVALPSYVADKTRGEHTGVIYSYAFGNEDITVATMDAYEDGNRSGDAKNDDDMCFCKCASSDVWPTSDIPLDKETIESLEPLVAPFCSVVQRIYAWTFDGEGKATDNASSTGSLLRWELACALMKSFSSLAPVWPSLFDNQVISTNGDCPAILFQLAQLCVRDLKVEDIEDMRALLWQMEWLRSRDMHFSLATRPISSSSLSTSDDKTCVLRPPLLMSDDVSPVPAVASDGSQVVPEPSEYFYNLYAFSSRADLPQHSGRNKMLEYWEKNVIPAIETYVSGSFKSYEMDYFFAQLREPLREGNAAAALKIAYTLCDGHVPSGCHYPDPNTDWSALQLDDVEIGSRYVIASDNVDVAGWPREMLWTLGHSGAVRVIDPSGMVLLQVINPLTSASEYWWYRVDSLRSISTVTSILQQSVTDFETSRSQLQVANQQLIYSIARRSVFDLLQVAPEHAMKLSIETRKTSLTRTSSAPFPLPSTSVAHTPMPTKQLAAPHPKDLVNSYNLADLLKLAAAAELGCPEKVLSSEMGMVHDLRFGRSSESGSNAYMRAKVSSKVSLITILQTVLNKQFERVAASPPPPVMDRSTSYDENASVMVTVPTKKQKKRRKQGSLMGKQGTAPGVTHSSIAASASSSSSSPPLNGPTMKTHQPKLQLPEVTPALSTRKYRYLLMEALLAELKTSFDLSSSFLRSRSFMVTSDSPPQPLIQIHVPDATCLVLSFAVHPVLMDLPAGSCLEFFRDERCTDRLFGYFGDKRGLSYLPPLVVPGEKCFVRISQGTYARYKFRVDAFTADFGLALWLCEEIYQKLLSVQLSHYEVETVLTAALNALAEYLIATTACLPSMAKVAVYQITAKLINFALGKGAMHAVPIAKLSGLVKELTFVYDNERTTQKGLYSLYTQQLAELISLVEEVSSLKGGSSSILGGAWWKEFVRMAVFSRVLAQGKREIATPDAFKRIYCGRAPIREIQSAHNEFVSHDLFSERFIFLQNLPRTSNIADLKASISRYLVHLALEECGESDDQNVYSAAAVTRFGIVSNILYMPVGSDGQTLGYAMVDIGRPDVIANLLTRIPKEVFEFEGGTATTENMDLLAKIEAVCRPPDSSRSKSNDGSDSCSGDGAGPGDDVWACAVCTLENTLSEAECAACGSPIPPELANLSREVQAQSQTEQLASSYEDVAANGWSCPTCTFVNSWTDENCGACTMERSADLVPPQATRSEDSHTDQGEDNAALCDDNSAGAMQYKLSAARFVEMLRVADETNEVPPQVTQFLSDQFFRSCSTHEVKMTTKLCGILQRETARYLSSPESKATVDAFAKLVNVKTDRLWNSMSAEERINIFVSGDAVLEAQQKPRAVYKWMRSSGYDLQFELSHYTSMDDAMEAQGKWTHQMDCQLIAVCRQLSGRLGVLMLTELCPSHLTAKLAHEYSSLASLQTRDMRLRLAVLQSLNRLLAASLPLVNLRPWSDPSSLRTRVVSIRQLIFPGVKIRFFAQTQDNTTLAHSVFVDTSAKRPMVTIDRRKVAGKRGGINASASEVSASLSALRNPKRSLFAATMEQLSAISPSLLRAKRPTGASDPFVSFIVIFAGENVVGEGGPYRQLFNDVSNELLATGNPLFIPTQNNVMKAGDFRERYMPKPSSTSKELLQMFEFVGTLMGCCLRTGVRLNLRLAPLVWKMLVKQSLVLADLESVDHSLCESLKFLEELAFALTDDPDEILYDSFTTTLSDGTVVELKAGGQHLPVTKANVKEYIRLVKATRLQECKPQVDAMLRGLGKIVPVQLLQLCVWSELQQWVSGSLEIDVKLLKRHTRYSSGMSPEQFPHLETFWKVLSSFSEENKRRFINFAWGQDTLPADDAEFDRTHTRLLIKAPPQDNGVDQDGLLPKADTCFFNIELPVYSSEKVMREKLLLAITLCTSLDGDEQTAGRDIYYAGDEVDDDVME